VIVMDTGWSRPPASLEIGPDDVHVWAAPLGDPGFGSVQAPILSRDERERAARLRSREREREFVTSRTTLRMLLAAYTGTRADRVRFEYGCFGKPALAEPDGSLGLTFNGSCSHGLALYAFARGRQVGVDVERLLPRFPCDPIAQQWFCQTERLRLSRLRGSRLTQTFFDYWCAKEALLKARGDGLSGGLNEIDVHRLDEDDAAVILESRARLWTVKRLAPKPAYAGAVAIEGKDVALRCWDLALGGLPSLTSGSRRVPASLN
jgi:4'-phosphopantetheinyl transferase